MRSKKKQKQIDEAINLLDEATTKIYNIEGDKWQMAYDLLEALLDNLKIEQLKYRGKGKTL